LIGRYDTTQYSIFTCTQKLTRQPNPAHGTETKKYGKLKRKPSSCKGMVRVIVREGSPRGRSETTELGFLKQVGFKPGVKERELWMNRVMNQKRKK